jgi:hypothetical protein
VSKLKAIIDSAKRAGIDKSQPPRQMPDEAARQGIRGYHGSPHDFPPVRELEMPDGAVVYQSMDDAVPEGARVIKEHPLGRFDMSKIGTGEGAQAYSRGLYFAEREKTAEGYRKNLSRDNLAQRAKDNQSYDTLVGLGLDESPELGAFSTILSEADGDMARAIQDSMTPRYPDDPLPAFAQSMADAMKSGRLPASIELPTLNKGSMYEVNIAATPDEFIDWDLPLDEQSESVMNALNKTDWYKYAEEGAYEAAGNRGDNPYGMDLVRWLEEDGAEDAAQMLKDAGIKGIQYADAQTRFGKGPKTKNYVVYDDKLISIAKKYGISIPAAAAVLAGTMTPQEAQAGMLDLGLRVLRGDSLDQIPAADPVESLVLGLSRQQSMENQGRDFVPTPDEMLESMSTILKPASTDPDVVSFKGLPTGGAYMGTPETALDVDIVSREDFIPVETLDLAAVQAAEDAQESWFVARRIENKTGDRAPEMFTVGTEIYFDVPKPANDKLIKKISDYLIENDVPAYTMIVDPSDANSVIGLRVLDIPQLSGNSKKYATMSKDEYKDTVERSYEQFGKLGRNLEKEFGQVKSATPAYFDVNIKSLADTQDYLRQHGNTARDPDALRQEFYGFKPAQERFRQWEGLSVPYYRDSKGTDPTGGNPTGGKESEGIEGLGFNYSFPKALGAGITGLGAMAALPPEEAQAGVIMTLQELAKRALAGDKDAAAELEKYGGPGRILDQFGDPRSMDLSNLDAVPNVPQFALERYDPPRGRPSNLDQLLTPETAERLEGYARRGENLGGRAWYNTLPLRDAFIAELGPKEGAARFERYIDIVAATSPRSRVDTNVRRSSYLYGEDKAGRPIAGLTNPDFPPGYGHLAHLTQDALLKDLEGGRSFRSLDRPKTSSFAENLKGNQQPMTIDTHNFSAITGDNKNKKSPSGTQYKYLEEFEVEIADKLNMSPAQFQASVWIGADTGVADARPFLEVFDDVVARTAKKKGVSKQKALTDFIRGNGPLFGLAALMTAGAILPQRSIASDAGMGVTSRATPDEVAFKAPREPRRIPEKQPPGIASLAGQLGLGAMSEIGGAILGGLSGVGEYVRGGGLLGAPVGAPATGESIRNINEGVSGYVGDLYDAGPEAQALGQQIMQGIGETIAPIAEYAMEGPITDEYGINMVPLIAQKLGIPAYELLERLYSMMPEREQEALKSGADAFL